jgi:hypothetical protein
MWVAERENAERFAARVRMIAPLCIAILGVLVASAVRKETLEVFENLPEVCRREGKGVFLACVALSALSLARATLRLLFAVRGATGTQVAVLLVVNLVALPLAPVDAFFWLLRRISGDHRRDHLAVFASDNLTMRAKELLARKPGMESPFPQPHWRALIRTYNAAVYLRNQNRYERQRLRTAEHDLGRGIILLVLALGFYAAAILWPMLSV